MDGDARKVCDSCQSIELQIRNSRFGLRSLLSLGLAWSDRHKSLYGLRFAAYSGIGSRLSRDSPCEIVAYCRKENGCDFTSSEGRKGGNETRGLK